MQNVVALIGPGRGPAIPLRAHPARAFVSGLNGGKLLIHHSQGALRVSQDGMHELPEVDSISAEYEGNNSSMICSVRF